jgi:hypothetical protein
MNLYDVIIRVGGSLYNEVEKHSVTAAEVIMLQALHGEDAVRVTKHAGTTDETNAAIRERMADFFGTGRVETGRSGPDLVIKHFGPKNMPLPDRLEGVMHINPQIAKDNAPLPPVKTGGLTSLAG